MVLRSLVWLDSREELGFARPPTRFPLRTLGETVAILSLGSEVVTAVVLTAFDRLEEDFFGFVAGDALIFVFAKSF